MSALDTVEGVIGCHASALPGSPCNVATPVRATELCAGCLLPYETVTKFTLSNPCVGEKKGKEIDSVPSPLLYRWWWFTTGAAHSLLRALSNLPSVSKPDTRAFRKSVKRASLVLHLGSRPLVHVEYKSFAALD